MLDLRKTVAWGPHAIDYIYNNIISWTDYCWASMTIGAIDNISGIRTGSEF